MSAYGEADARRAKHGVTLKGNVPCRVIAYHAKLCAEKYNEASLVYNRIDFPYAHTIAHVLEK